MNTNSGRVMYNNGVEMKFFKKDEHIPDGWVKGQIPISNEEKNRRLEKMKKTCLKKYGVEYINQSDDIKKKKEETCIKNLGVKYPVLSEGFKTKSKQTSLKKYGTESPMQSQEIKDKFKKTSLERYGVENPFQSEEKKKKISKTMLERYGVEHALQSEEIQQKMQSKIKGVYGTHFMNTKEVKEKTKQTNLERYGTEWGFQSEEVKEKSKQTNIKKYGVASYVQSDEYKSKIKTYNLEKYGVEQSFSSKEVRDKASKTMLERYGVAWYVQNPEIRKGFTNNSVPNQNFANILESYNINYEREFPLKHYSYDFKVGNILIEINPYATHNSLWGLYGEKSKKSINYHQKKSQTAEAEGYQVIHIFDWDNPELIIQNVLLQKEKVYARKTKVFGIEKSEVRSFLNEHHLQGTCNGQQVCLGLRNMYGELISLMTFGKPRYNKNYQWELLRYCSSKAVIGGAEKLFTHFIKEHNPESIISYCDRSKFRGDVYKKLGFTKLREGNPSCHWYGTKDRRHITSLLLIQRGFDQLFGTTYGKGTSNEELMIEHGFVPIYDCGQSSYIWVKTTKKED